MTLGEKLFQLRKQRGISQEELAEHLDVSRQAISKWELSESLPDTKNIIQLGKLFDVSMDYLLNDDIEKDILRNKQDTIPSAKSKLKISMTMLSGCVLTFLGVCSLLIFWILSIVNPAEYSVGKGIPIDGGSTTTGAKKIYDGLQGFLMCNDAGGLFIFCCCVIFVGLVIILFDKIILQPKKIGSKISSRLLTGYILTFLGICSLILFWLISFVNPLATFRSQDIITVIFYIISCSLIVVGTGLIVFDIMKKKKV